MKLKTIENDPPAVARVVTLTAKQEAFCIAYLSCGNASGAYRQSYDASGMLPETIHRKAKDTMDNGKIAARLQELRAPAVAEARMTLEGHLNDLASIRNAAVLDGQYGPAVAAERSRGQAAGFYQNPSLNAEPIDVTSRKITPDMTPEQAAQIYFEKYRSGK